MLSVRENLECFAAVNRLHAAAARDAITHALNVTQLNDYTKARGERLSGGLKRRLNLAIALLAKPELLVLDEPTVGVDAQSRHFLLDTIKRLAAEGAAVIYTTHYLEEIEAIADQVAILHRGEILRHGSLDSLLAEGAAHVTVQFAETPPVSLLQHVQTLGSAQLAGKQLRLQLNPGIAPLAALNVIATCGVPMLELQAGRHTLEQLFMQLTGEPMEASA
ncbi:MAG: ATP-binding cassette domain-containing protein, partial [Thiobacillus sp.]